MHSLFFKLLTWKRFQFSFAIILETASSGAFLFFVPWHFREWKVLFIACIEPRLSSYKFCYNWTIVTVAWKSWRHVNTNNKMYSMLARITIVSQWQCILLLRKKFSSLVRSCWRWMGFINLYMRCQKYCITVYNRDIFNGWMNGYSMQIWTCSLFLVSRTFTKHLEMLFVNNVRPG